MPPFKEIITERGDKLNETIKINNHDVVTKEYNGQRVVTFKDIDIVHERSEGTARKRFNDNKKHFIKGEDFYKISPSEFRTAFGLDMDARQQNDVVVITESGYLMLVKSFTDDLAWDVQRKLVSSYFKAKEIVNQELSPQTQMLLQLAQSIADKELEDKERDRQIAIAKETASKAVETTENIKEAMTTPFINWRDDVNAKVREIAIRADMQFQQLFSEMYKELERKAGCDLSARQRNKRDRMKNSGCRKSDIDRETTKIAVIEEDKRLKQIFDDIVRRYAVKYVS